MGQPGAKKGDDITSVTPGDIHIVMVPAPSGQVPTPLPHPVPSSTIKDDVADKVKVEGAAGAVKGSISHHSHTPTPPGVSFQKQPANQGKIVTASANVFYEGKEAAMLGDTAEMCADPSDAPVGKVMGTASTVLIGGGGSGSDEARAQASIDSMLAASAECHKWINANMPPGADRDKAHRDVCTATGHPVDVATGKLFTKNVDLKLPGRIPFEFTRNYSSARSDVGAFGRSWRHSYEAQLIVHHGFVAHRDQNGRFLEFEPIPVGGASWNKLGRLTLRRSAEGYSVEDPDGLRQLFFWSGTPADAAVILPLMQIRDRYNNRITLEYANARLTRTTDSAGRIILLDYNERGFISALRLVPDPAVALPQTIRTYLYSIEDDLIEVRDAEAHSLRFAYANHLLVQEMDRTGFSFYFTYDKDGWCLETWGDGGILYRGMYYDRQKRQTRVINSLGETTKYSWTVLGVVTKETDHWGGIRSTKYNDFLQIVRVEDQIGNGWAYEYDDKGRLILAEDPEGNSASLKWDAEGRLTVYSDLAGLKWQRTYGQSNSEILTDPMGGMTTEYRNEHGDLTQISHPDGTETLCTYNASGDLIAVRTPTGLQISRQHSATGDLLLKADQFGARIEIGYDSMRRVERISRRGKGETRLSYDAEGRVIRLTDPQCRVTRYEYSQFNKLSRVASPDAVLFDGRSVKSEKRYSYDTENRLTLVEMPGGEKIVFHYDGRARPMRVEYPDGRVQTFRRDARGFITKLTENGTLVYEQASDSAGRVTRRMAGDGEEFTYDYDPFGSLLRASGSAEDSLVEIARDEIGRVLTERGALGATQFERAVSGKAVQYSWNEELQLLFQAAPSQTGTILQAVRKGKEDIRLDFDSENRLQRAKFASGELHELDYGNWRQPVQRRAICPNGGTRTEDFTYNPEGWLQGVDLRDVCKHIYERDEWDRLTGLVIEKNEQRRRYSWGYDPSSNRVLATSPEGEEYRLRFVQGHRPVQIGTDQLVYDDRGRVIAITDADRRTTRYTWDAMGRLRQVRLPDEEIIEMRYDALGRRIEKLTSRGRTRFGWLDNRMVHEELPAGEQRHYVYHPESFSPLACYISEPDGAYRLHAFLNDLRGAPIRLTNDRGEVIWEEDSGPWGERSTSASANFEQPIAMTGQYRDTETGLHYNYARYYLPRAGAYLSPDPTGLAGGDDAYAYVTDPICWRDPLGLSADDYDGGPVKIYHGTLDERALRETGFTTVNKRGSPVEPPYVCITTDQKAADDAAFTNLRPTGEAPAVLVGTMSREEWDRLHSEGHLTTNKYTGWGVSGSTETKARTPEGVGALNKAFGLPGG